MRDELLPLLDKPVMLIGRLTAKEREGSSLKACIKNPRVYKWSRFLNEEQIESQRPIKTDHLWIYAHVSSTIGDVEDAMLANIKIYGHLSYYTRADGSTDIGLMWTPSVKFIGQHIQFYYLTHKYEEVLSGIKTMEKTGVWEFCADYSSSAAENWAKLQVYRRGAERALQAKLPVKEGSAIFL